MRKFAIILLSLLLSGFWGKSQLVQGILLNTVNTLNPVSTGQTKMYFYKQVEITELSFLRTHTIRKKGKTDSIASYHITKYFIRKNGDEFGRVFDSLTALQSIRTSRDSINISKAILQLQKNQIYEKIIHDYKPAASSVTGVEKYIPVVKTGPEMADSINFYFSDLPAIKNIPFSFSPFADSSHAAKLIKIEIIYHNPTREGKIVYMISPMEVINEKMIMEFVREYMD